MLLVELRNLSIKLETIMLYIIVSAFLISRPRCNLDLCTDSGEGQACGKMFFFEHDKLKKKRLTCCLWTMKLCIWAHMFHGLFYFK